MGALQPRVAFAPDDDSGWIADDDGGGYAVNTRTIVVTRPQRPQLFRSVDDWTLSVYALNDGRRLGQETFDSNEITSVFPTDNAALLTFDDGTSIRVGE